MICPICSKTITFPAIPPGGVKQKLHLKRAETAQAAKWSFSLAGIIAALRGFEHWKLVLMGLVPFVIAAALLVGAKVVKHDFSDDTPAPVVAPQAQAVGWDKMKDLARAEQEVQARLAVLAQDQATVASFKTQRSNLDNEYRNKPMSPAAQMSHDSRVHAADQNVQAAQIRVDTDKNLFDNSFSAYQQLGGKIDYRRQLPQ